ncbi:MAG TPA: branched-chain amino acid ABC transporter permease, partial [Verrucomicrobiae bacterium]|nr:branched-chain amino acid ABC transporter permease [Verrucomicrobiae bacterium]
MVGAGVLLASAKVNPYIYFAGYVILQYVVIATAWNILGGYAGYVNFGTPAFFALGAYTAVFLVQTVRPPLPLLILAGGLVS